jgi:hypothetical protein
MSANRADSMKNRSFTIILACITLVVLVLSAPASLSDAFRRGGFYLFSHDFLEDIPKRLSGPGRFRFVLQPLVAIILGMRGGLGDARAGRPAYLYGVLFRPEHRRELLKTGFATVVNLVLMGILIDSVCQWFIFGISYPGAALIVGPVLIGAPYTISRAFTNRLSRACGKDC